MPKANSLSIDVPGVASLQHSDAGARSGLASPRTPHTPRSPSTNNNGTTENSTAQYGEGYENHAHSPINALPRPPSPRSPKSASKAAKLFGNKLASKSATKLNKSSNNHADLSPQQPPIGNKGSGNNTSQVHLGSSNSNVAATSTNQSSTDVSVSHPHSGQSSPDAVEFSPDQHSSSTTANNNANTDATGSQSAKQNEKGGAKSKAQHKFGSFLSRKTSLRGDDQLPPPPPTAPLTHSTTLTPTSATSPGREKPKLGPIKAPTQPIDVPLRTAPVEKERGFRTAMSSALRNRSLDRADDDRTAGSSQQPHHTHKPSLLGPGGLQGASSTNHKDLHGSVMSNLRSGSTKAAEGINKARKGLFGNLRLNRSGSSHEREPIRNEPYELKVLVLPLEEQARITRIAKRLHYCKDKTEFWLPAFPYRCIDYLSDRGTYSEGLYRVPGSELEIKHYMARFDKEYDIDLFEQKDLHDVNVVATMLKRWLSNLPPVFPQDVQSDIIRTCSESHPAVQGGSTPDYMKQKLSELPPWNYYLLFAITGHISFLHNHRDQNKMTYENLFRCFATRALQVEPYIFWWLVWDWRNCWLGCAREDEYKAKEYTILDQMAEEERERNAQQQAAAEARAPPQSKKEKDERQPEQSAKQRKASKHSVSAISKQTVLSTKEATIKQVKSEHRPRTAHAHSPSTASHARSRSREKKSALTDRQQREQEREQREKDRALSSSDSSKPSIAEQSPAYRSGSPGNGVSEERDEQRETTNGNDGPIKTQDIGLPMLSPLKPLSPLGLH
ncbi:uncharacterized protein PV09_07236 [Verruconis gallopava]|uniref:Rho-GAP domain-containing protein n=1 Tax=Verruconis gallopava TaxID=253628 RepID=A0A0D2A3U4_9PEZI|nr:uncharacterized protein PV09_07236 [Verruconis gallopava]KIW01483.1 hypothetical protein PV09_07236 [Verruconis gallopava]